MDVKGLLQRIRNTEANLSELLKIREEVKLLTALHRHLLTSDGVRELYVPGYSKNVAVPCVMLADGIRIHIHNLRCKHRKLAEKLKLDVSEWEIKL